MSARVVRRNTGQTAGENATVAPRRAALIVRRANPGDGVPLTFFFDTILRKDYFIRRGQLTDMLTGQYHQVYVAELDTVLVGVAVTTRETRLVNVLVHPAYRGLGIGAQLVQRSGASEVRAKTDMSNGDPRAFYQSLGFEPTGQFNPKGNIELMRVREAVNGKRRRERRAAGGGAAKPAARKKTGTDGTV